MWRDRRRLRRALAQAQQARLYRRLEAVLLVAEGHPLSFHANYKQLFEGWRGNAGPASA